MTEKHKEDKPDIVEDGELIIIESGSLRHTCCNCGMVHLIVFDRAVRNGDKVILTLLDDELGLRFYKIEDGKK